VRLADIVTVSETVASTRSRRSKVELLASLLKRLAPDESSIGVSYLAGRPRQNRLGVGYATVFAVEVEPSAEPQLEISEVDSILESIATASGTGSQKQKESLLGGLLARATTQEQFFLRGLILRNLRQGALEGVMADAVAVALDVSPDRVRRAAMLEGDLIEVASRALAEGPGSLAETGLKPLTPVQPMLAKTAGSAAEAVAAIGLAYVECKLDGARIQVHRDGDKVAVFTRNLRDATDSLPEVVAAARGLESRSFILDGEVLLMGPTGSPRQFQDSMSRFGTEQTSGQAPLTVVYFDCLHLDGTDLIDEPLRQRRLALSSAVTSQALVESVLTDDPDLAEAFFEDMVAAGYEGVVVKDPDQPYAAGRRGSGWLKVKPTHTLDLVVLAAEWGSGRRQGKLSNLHLGARDETLGLVMLGKTFKGLTDEMLDWQTLRFLQIEDHREGNVVFLKPEIVYEIAFDGVQRSTRYPGGVTLRFARVKRFRDDKGPGDADTLATVRAFLRS